MMELEGKRSNYLLSLAVGLLTAFILRYFEFSDPDGVIGINTLGNIKAFILFACAALIPFFLLNLILNKVNTKALPGIIITVIYLTSSGFAYIKLYGHFEHGSTVRYVAATTIFVIGLLLVSFVWNNDRFKKTSLILTVAEIAVFSVVWYLAVATPNTFTHFSFGRTYNIYHSSAYLDQIANVYFDAPFTGCEAELYGHYGLFFYLPLKIFGNGTGTIAVILGIMAAVTFICAATALSLSIKNFILRALSILALMLYGISCRSIYWQTYPHRLFFPALFIAIFAICAHYKRFTRLIYFLGLILTVAAFTWNTETGAVCMVVWAFFGGMALAGKKPAMRVPATLLALLINTVTTVLLSLALVNIHNARVGGEALGLRGFLGVQAAGFVQGLSKPMDGGNALYIHIFILMLLCTAKGIHDMFISEEYSVRGITMLATGLTGLGVSIYFSNNPENGTGILNLYFMMCAGLVAAGAKLPYNRKEKKWDAYAASSSFIAMYAFLAIFMGYAMGRELPFHLKAMHDVGAWNHRDFEAWCEELDTKIAPDTKGASYGTAALFLELERDRGGRDFQFHMEEMGEPEHFLKFVDGPTEFEGYELIEFIHYEEVAFGYYQKAGS